MKGLIVSKRKFSSLNNDLNVEKGTKKMYLKGKYTAVLMFGLGFFYSYYNYTKIIENSLITQDQEFFNHYNQLKQYLKK